MRRKDPGGTGLHFSDVLKITALLLVLLASVQTRAQVGRDSLLKAVYLVKLCHFVEWPASAFAGSSAPLVISILGYDPFGASLDQCVQGELVDGHKLVVQRYQDAADVKPCQILFINEKESDHTDLLRSMAGHGTLTVSSDRNFIRQGGMIRFQIDNNRIKLEINADAARQENILISSKLLRIASVSDPNNH
jgi:hypothetical protein